MNTTRCQTKGHVAALGDSVSRWVSLRVGGWKAREARRAVLDLCRDCEDVCGILDVFAFGSVFGFWHGFWPQRAALELREVRAARLSLQ
jgi:hypothetical protein